MGDIRLVDLDAFAVQVADEIVKRIGLRDLFVPGASPFHTTVKAAVQEAAAKAGEDVNRPRYRSAKEDGNPITFLVQHYRLDLEQGRYYQSDLHLEDEKLFNALKNVFKSRSWHKAVAEAVRELRASGQPTLIAGRDLEDVSEFRHLVPPRTVRTPAPELVP